jgi:hypothetical protein
VYRYDPLAASQLLSIQRLPNHGITNNNPAMRLLRQRIRRTENLMMTEVPNLKVRSLRLGWAGLGWAGLDWAGLGWAGLGWAGLGWEVLISRLRITNISNLDSLLACTRAELFGK